MLLSFCLCIFFTSGSSFLVGTNTATLLQSLSVNETHSTMLNQQKQNDLALIATVLIQLPNFQQVLNDLSVLFVEM